MSDFSITDSLGNSASNGSWTSASSLLSYAKSESLHLMVVPDFMARKDEALTQAAPDPAKFDLSLQHDFQVGGTAPEVDITPGAEVTLTVNAKSGADLFEGDSFHLTAKVPEQTGYVGLSMKGSLDLGVSGSDGNLTFGIDAKSSIEFKYLKAFPTDHDEPTLGAATTTMLAGFVIPASVADLKLPGVNDVCAVSGQGSLKVSGGVKVSTPVNPLASVSLPLGTGTLTVQDGLLAGLSASFTLTGSYQIRLQWLAEDSVRLSYVKESGTTFEIDTKASAGVTVDLGKTDLLAKLLGTIEKGAVDQKVLASLRPDEITDFNKAIKDGLDHSLQAALDLALSTGNNDQAAFQYEIQPALLDGQSSQAVDRALKGDLSLLTALEGNAGPDGAIAPGVKLLNSMFSKALTKGASLKINLIGIVNLISMSNLVSKCEFLFEPASGDLTIKETAQSEKIGAITDPINRQEALRKALYDSVLATTTYVAGKAVTMPDLRCQAVHFAVNQKTNQQTMADYTNWFVALSLMTAEERAGILSGFDGGGASTCAVRADLDDALCEALFFDEQGALRSGSEYTEIGRRALMALLDPADSDMDGFRYRFLADENIWKQAVEMGPSPRLRTLIPLASTDPRFTNVLGDVSGDLSDIVGWSDGMRKAGQALQQMRAFLAGRDPAALAGDPGFASHRDGLQKLMVSVVGSSKMRFQAPWGLVCLFQAAGSAGSSGKLTAGTLVIDKSSAGKVAVAGR